MSRLVHFIALAILLNAAPAFSQCSAAASGAGAPTTSGFVVGSTAALSYAFRGQTAPANGIVCPGCAKYEAGATSGTAGDWYTVDDIAVGATTTKTGFFCPSAGEACITVAEPVTTASTTAGKFYSKTTIAKDVTATETGVLCPAAVQTGNPANYCGPVAKDSIATFLGTACDGTTGACTAVVKGYVAPTNGVSCQGCVYKNAGETANLAGNFWTYAGELASGAASTSANPGIFCPSNEGVCSMILAGAAAPSAGKYVSWTAVAVGATAPTAGVLCPNIPGFCTADGTECEVTKAELPTASQAAAVAQGIPAVEGKLSTIAATPIVTTGQGNAIGYTNSAHKSTLSMFALIVPMLAVVKMVFCN